MNAIETHGLTRTFWRKEAVHDLDLVVPTGSFFAYLGPNGAGKTTTIKLLMNLIRPTAGEATVLGVPATGLRPEHFAEIGYVSEDQEMPEWMSVGRLLAYLRPFYPSWDEALCRDLLTRFELPLDRPIKYFSRGMKMKARLVSSLVYRPRLLVLDEPFSGLDPLVRDQLVEGILELGDREGWTVFISSHDLSEVESLCSHVGFLQEGRLVLAESLESLQDRFREVEVLFTEAPTNLPATPSHWLHPELSGRLLRAVDPRYEPGSENRIRAELPGVEDVTAAPMTLKGIFLALARTKGV